MDKQGKEKKSFKVPHIFAILALILLFVAILSYILPAGEFDRVLDEATGRSIIVADSYHTIEASPTSIMQYLEAIPGGFVDAGWLAVLTFAVGGGFAVFRKTGTINASINALTKKLAKRDAIIIPILMLVFTAIDCFIGMPELCMVYVPIILPLMLALGYDAIVACATALVGSAVGFTAAIANPFTVIIAQKVCDLPLYSGWQFRLICMALFSIVSIIYVMRYAAMVKKDAKKSLVYGDKINMIQSEDSDAPMTGRQKLVGITVLVLFLIMIFGVFNWGWDTPEIGGIFVAIGIASGVIYGMNADEISEAFLEGCHDVLLGAIAVGMARGVSVLMSDANITDTIVNGMASFISALPPTITSVGMLIMQNLLNFLVPSGSGQAVIAMPILSSLADIVGVTKQTTVLAFQFGDGFSNLFYPTCGFLMATLAIVNVPYQKWFRFIAPLFAIWTVMAAIILVFAQTIGWGPF